MRKQSYSYSSLMNFNELQYVAGSCISYTLTIAILAPLDYVE